MNYLRDQASTYKTGIIVKKNTKPKPKKVDFEAEAKKLGVTVKEYKKRYFEALRRERKENSTTVALGKQKHRREVRQAKKTKKQRLKKIREETKLDNYYKMLDEKYNTEMKND
jgi:predicted transcriptional regulator